MKGYRLAVLVGVFALTGVFGVLAQSDTVKQYSSKDVKWRVHETVDYSAKPEKGAKSFLSVSTDADGKIYVVDFTNIAVYDSKTGKQVGTLYDSTGTITRPMDIVGAGDGNYWISDFNLVYKVDPTGKILSTVKFKTSPGFSDRGPGYINVDAAGSLYVSYGGNGGSLLIQVFTPEGEYIQTILSEVGKLQGVGEFVVAPDNSIYFVAAGIGHATEVDGKVVVEAFAPEFMAEQKFIQFRGLAIDADNNIYFSAGSDPDKATSVYKLNKAGQLVGQYGVAQARDKWGGDFGKDELSFTVSLALASDGALIISDTNNLYSQLIKVDMQE